MVSGRWGDKVNLTKLGEMKIENTRYGFREAIPFKSLTAGRADRLIIDDPHSTESAEATPSATPRSASSSKASHPPQRPRNRRSSSSCSACGEDVSGVALANDLGYTHLNLPMGTTRAAIASPTAMTAHSCSRTRAPGWRAAVPRPVPQKVVELQIDHGAICLRRPDAADAGAARWWHFPV